VIRRRVFNSASAVSLLLSAATTVLWVRSHYFSDWFQCADIRWAIDAHSTVGELWVYRLELAASDQGGSLGHGWGDTADRISPVDRIITGGLTLGFGRLMTEIQDYSGKNLGQFAIYFFPHWALASMFGLLPVGWIVGFLRRRRRSRRGGCPACGYDMRASPKQCPECGTPAPGTLKVAE